MTAMGEPATPLCSKDAAQNTSSAMPDLSSADVPILKARVHQQVTLEECSKIPLGALRFRPLQPSDHDEMLALHTEWFPVSYNEAFYTKSVEGAYFTLVATYRHGDTPGANGVDANGSCTGSVKSGQGEESILGMITMSTVCEHHCDDITTVLGADCESICRRVCPTAPAKDSSNPDAEEKRGCLAYILTLGVSEGFRRRGLARELLARLNSHVDKEMPQIQAIYLHVVTYNTAAIRLYESMHYQHLGSFVGFYQLHGKPYDSFLYARYVHSGKPPWSWRLKNLFGIRVVSWKDWIMSALSSFWHDHPAEPDVPRSVEGP